MGSFDKKTKTSAKSTSTATTAPNVPGFIQQPAANYYGQVNSLMSQPPTASPATANQRSAFAGASSLSTPNNAILEALNGTRGLMNFSPDNVTAGQLRDTNMAPYMNPYTESVVDASLANIERARAGAISGGQGAATQAHAYGGSRHGVADSLTNEAALRTAGSTAAGLRESGYARARADALADIANKLQADTGNAERGVSGAGIRLGAANQLGSQGLGADANMRSNLTTQAGLGEVERGINAENDPNQARFAQLAQIAQLLGIDPSLFIGQQINQSGSSSGTNTQSGSPMDTLGQLLQIGSMFAGKPA